MCCVCYVYSRKEANKSSLKNTFVIIFVILQTHYISYHTESIFFCHVEVISLRKVAGVNVLLPFSFWTHPVWFSEMASAAPWSDAGVRPAGLDPRCTSRCLALGWLVLETWGCWQWMKELMELFLSVFIHWAESIRASLVSVWLCSAAV